MAKLKEHYIDWILDEQMKGNIHGVKWTTDDTGVHFSFSVDPERLKAESKICPTYRKTAYADADDVQWYAEIA